MAKIIQPVASNDLYQVQKSKSSPMIDNYVYLYHTDTLIAIPTYPEQISDTMGVNYQNVTPLSRSAPIYTYQNSGPRSFQVEFALHRDMMNDINTAMSKLNIPDLAEEDYVDILIKQLQAVALPKYASAQKMVNPPLIAVRLGTDIFCKGVVNGSVNVTYSGPILRTNKYALVNISFTINEVDPYDAESVMTVGGYRGLSTTLEHRIWKGAAK